MSTDKFLYEIKIQQQQSAKILNNMSSILKQILEQLEEINSYSRKTQKQQLKESIVNTKLIKNKLLTESKKVVKND